MRLRTNSILLLALLALTVVPGLKTIAKAYTQGAPPAIPLTLPSCAEPALKKQAKIAGCKINSSTCLCSKPNLFPHLMADIQSTCGNAARGDVVQFVEAYCGFNPLRTTTTTTIGPSGGGPKSVAPATMTRTGHHHTGHHAVTHAASTEQSDGHTVTAMSKTTKTMPTETATSTGSAEKSIGAAARIEGGLSKVVLVAGMISAMGWVLAEL